MSDKSDLIERLLSRAHEHRHHRKLREEAAAEIARLTKDNQELKMRPDNIPEKCPTCDSPAPHLHPAMQFEGEVQPCRDDFHLWPTPENLPHLRKVRAANHELIMQALADEGQAREIREVRVVFDGPPSHESGRFIEVENSDGASIRCGEWVERPDGYWELRFRALIEEK